MSRAAQAMCADWLDKPRILAGSAELRAALSLVRSRQGTKVWQDTVQDTVRREADFVLVAETGLSEGQVSLRLTLVDLSDGRVIVKTSDIEIAETMGPAGGDPRAAITATIAQFLDMLPAARTAVTVGPFANEASGLETSVGQTLADYAVEAWLGSALSITALLRDAPPAQVLRGPRPATGFYLSGTIRLIDRDRFQLVLHLSQDGALRAARTLTLSSLQLPAHLRDMLDPALVPLGNGLDGFAEALMKMGQGALDITVSGGRAGVFPICRATDPRRLLIDCQDSMIQLGVTADQSGELICLSLDEGGLFYVMLPDAHVPALYLSAGQRLTLPDDLPLLPDGNRIYWPAMGPPTETLIGCALYPRSVKPIVDRLAEFQGSRLSSRDISTLRAVLRDASPAAAFAVRVRIVD